MQVQIVRASTRHRALAEARRLIGPDPLVLSVRRRPGSRGGEEWEAIVARDTPEPVLPAAAAPRPESGEAAPEPAPAQAWSELERFRSELADFRASLSRGRLQNSELMALAHRLSHLEGALLETSLRGRELPERWAPLARRLEEAGYPRADALRVVQQVESSVDDDATQDWKQFDGRIRDAILDGVRVAPTEERIQPGLVVFTGGAGVGKTTMAAKLAADLCLGGAASPVLGMIKPRKGVGLETVRRCAAALGIEFVEVRDKQQLGTLAERAVDAPVILDTPSINPLNEVGLKGLEELLTGAPSAEVHTVVSACYAENDLDRAVEAFAWAPKRRLSATHLDEAPYVGRVMAAAGRSGIPIGYLSLGPRIPDDLARPGLDSLVDSVLQAEGVFAS